MATFTFTIPNDKAQDILDAFKGIYPIPEENQGTEEEPDMQPAYTEVEWAKLKMKDYVVDTVRQHKRKVAIEAANVDREDDIITYE